ncbi:MAG: hypothetical protein R3253_09570 [Longimicrobiales bacterium]|nr:hypothetical protein [Longimicrobiales bacterium]
MKNQARTLWDELVRRRVVRTGAVYAVVAFVTLQLAEIVFPAYGVGPEGLRALIAALIAAGPLILAASWVYDMSGPEIRRTPEREAPLGGAEEGSAPSLRAVGAVVAAALALGGVSWWILGGMVGSSVLLMGLPSLLASVAVLFAVGWCSVAREQVSPRPRDRSVAVLPFACWGPAVDSGLGESLAEEIRARLQPVEGLYVAARWSCGDRTRIDDPRELGRILNVSTLVEGSILRHGSGARVTVHLVDARTGYRVFAKTWDLELGGSEVPQNRLADTIVRELLGDPEDQRLLRAV